MARSRRQPSTRRTDHEPEYSAFLAGRRVVLVGPAASIVGRGLGPWIDGHDVIVRMNLSCPLPRELAGDVGSRTDVLYHRLLNEQLAAAIGYDHSRQEIESWAREGVRFVVAAQPHYHPRVTKFRSLLPAAAGFDPPRLLTLDPKLLVRVRDQVAASPSLGTYTIVHLLAHDVAQLSVTGVDWYQTAYHVGYGGFDAERAARGTGAGHWGQLGARPSRKARWLNPRLDAADRGRPHPQVPQMRFLRRLAEQDPRLVFDELAAEILAGLD